MKSLVEEWWVSPIVKVNNEIWISFGMPLSEYRTYEKFKIGEYWSVAVKVEQSMKAFDWS